MGVLKIFAGGNDGGESLIHSEYNMHIEEAEDFLKANYNNVEWAEEDGFYGVWVGRANSLFFEADFRVDSQKGW